LAAGGLISILWLNVAGMTLWMGVFTFAMFLIICWGMARLVVESGIMFAKATQMMPSKVLQGIMGTAPLPPAGLTVLTFVEYVLMYDLKSFLMPQIMHSHKLADEGHVDRRSMYCGIGAAVLAAVAASYWASLKVAYLKGALAMHPWFFLSGPRGTCERLQSLLTTPTAAELNRVIALAAGAGLCWLLYWARSNFLWFPLHPIGYILGSGFEPSRMWFPFLVGWAVKALVMRYGSVKAYRTLRVPFLGLALGEFAAAGIWLIVDALLGRVGHRVFP
jgi:hypothetical protein